MTNSLFFGAIVGAWAVLWTEIMTEQGAIFGRLKTAYFELFGNSERSEFFAKPLLTCPICHAGQLAFWGGFAWSFTPFEHFAAVVVAMSSALLIIKQVLND